MKDNYLQLFTGLIIIALITGICSGSRVIVENGHVNTIDDTSAIDIHLLQIPSGLSGYNISISIGNASVADITGFQFPEWTDLNDTSGFPASSVWIKAADLSESIKGTVPQVNLGSVIIRGKAGGITSLDLTINQLDDSQGNPIDTVIQSGTFKVNETPNDSHSPSENTPPLGAKPVEEGGIPYQSRDYFPAQDSTLSGQNYANSENLGNQNPQAGGRVEGSEEEEGLASQPVTPEISVSNGEIEPDTTISLPIIETHLVSAVPTTSVIVTTLMAEMSPISGGIAGDIVGSSWMWWVGIVIILVVFFMFMLYLSIKKKP